MSAKKQTISDEERQKIIDKLISEGVNPNCEIVIIGVDEEDYLDMALESMAIADEEIEAIERKSRKKAKKDKKAANEDREEMLDLIDMQFDNLFELERNLSELAAELFKIKEKVDEAILSTCERHMALVRP